MMELLWKSKAKKNEKGFTLVELIVVVAILGILAVIGITRFAGLTDSARIKADTASAASIASAAQVWIAQQDSAPTGPPTLAQLQTDNLIDEPKDPQYRGGTWTIGYTPADKKLTVTDGTNGWYPAPTKTQVAGY